MTRIVTYSGRVFDYSNVESNQIFLEDIVQSLGNTNRYLGHGDRLISVAEHTIHVFNFLFLAGASSKVIRMGLLHDAAEAYVGDMPSPLKQIMREFVEFENRVQRHIFKTFGINDWTTKEMEQVKDADWLALMYENRAKPLVNPKDELRSLLSAYV